MVAYDRFACLTGKSKSMKIFGKLSSDCSIFGTSVQITLFVSHVFVIL